MLKSRPSLILFALVASGFFLSLIDFLFYRFDNYFLNKNYALGLIASNYLFCVGLFLVIGFLVFLLFFRKNLSVFQIIAISVIAAGGAVNCLERFLLGGVVDYLRFFGIFDFNIADIVIVGSTILLLGDYLLKTKSRD